MKTLLTSISSNCKFKFSLDLVSFDTLGTEFFLRIFHYIKIKRVDKHLIVIRSKSNLLIV